MSVDIIVGVVVLITIGFLVAILENYAKERKRQKDLKNRWKED